jgi:MFS family permease
MASDVSGSSSVVPGGTRPAAAEGRGLSRLIAWLTGWWLAGPLLFWAVLLLGENDRDTYHVSLWDLMGAALGWIGLGGVVLAPVVGLVAASIGRRRRACGRFALMGAVSVAFFLVGLYVVLHAD